jgi:tetratricopeptide (TPR) repeat protein
MKQIGYFIAILLSFCFFSMTAQDKKVLDSLQRIYNSTLSDSTKTLILVDIANEFRASNPDTSIILSKKSYYLAKNIHFKKGEAWAAARMADAFRRKNNLDSALIFYKEAQVLFDSIVNTDKGKGVAYNGIASISYSRGEYLTALENFEKALFFRQLTDDKMGISISLNGVGNSYYGIGNYPAALSFYQSSLKMKEEIKDKLGVGISFNNIAQIYYQQKQYDTALVYLKKSMAIKEEMKDKSGMTYSLNNIAGVYFDQQKYDLALEYHNKSLTIKEELGDNQGIATSLNNLAQVYVSQKKYQIAIEYYMKALVLERASKDKQGMIYSLNGLAKVYKDTRKYNESIKNSLEALAIAKNINALSELKDVYETLYQTSKLQGNIAKALTYFELHKSISDSLFNGEKIKVLNNLNTSYELSKKQQQIMLLQENKILQENKLIL